MKMRDGTAKVIPVSTACKTTCLRHGYTLVKVAASG